MIYADVMTSSMDVVADCKLHHGLVVIPCQQTSGQGTLPISVLETHFEVTETERTQFNNVRICFLQDAARTCG